MDNWTVSDVTGHAGVIGQYLANAIISSLYVKLATALGSEYWLRSVT